MSEQRLTGTDRAALQTAAATSEADSPLTTAGVLRVEAPVQHRHRLFLLAWYMTNLLLLLSLFAVFYTIAWEYSTRLYLKGFSDAVIPAGASPDGKIQAILDWMSHGPARLRSSFAGAGQDRDPIDTLNYDFLLRVCGTATNAFINLANSAGLPSRRLLLLNANQGAMHVDAEVLVDRRWIVVDPRIPRDSPKPGWLYFDDGAAYVTGRILGHHPEYPPLRSQLHLARTAHVRTARLGLIGTSVQKILDSLLPESQDSVAISLLLERESLGSVAATIMIVLFLILVRASLRWYGENRLRVYPVHVRERLRRAYRAFLAIGT